jgi:hypothetical protein
MVLKNTFAASIGLMLLAWCGLAGADQYRPDEFLGLDLSKAVLSPKPLGPPAQFARVGVEAKADHDNDARPVRVQRVTNAKVSVLPLDSERRRATAHTKLTHRRSPLDAQALDSRIQVWPCKSGGICNWKPQAN